MIEVYSKESFYETFKIENILIVNTNYSKHN